MRNVKQDIISFMAGSGADVGHVFAVRPFYAQRANDYTPPEIDAIEPALGSLVAEGVLEKRGSSYFLTMAGLDRLYPGGEADAIKTVRADMLQFLRSSKARVGHSFAAKPFYFQYGIRYNPHEQRAIEKAVDSLTQEGLLEERDGGQFLTQLGYERIYDR